MQEPHGNCGRDEAESQEIPWIDARKSSQPEPASIYPPSLIVVSQHETREDEEKRYCHVAIPHNVHRPVRQRWRIVVPHDMKRSEEAEAGQRRDGFALHVYESAVTVRNFTPPPLGSNGWHPAAPGGKLIPVR